MPANISCAWSCQGTSPTEATPFVTKDIMFQSENKYFVWPLESMKVACMSPEFNPQHHRLINNNNNSNNNNNNIPWADSIGNYQYIFLPTGNLQMQYPKDPAMGAISSAKCIWSQAIVLVTYLLSIHLIKREIHRPATISMLNLFCRVEFLLPSHLMWCYQWRYDVTNFYSGNKLIYWAFRLLTVNLNHKPSILELQYPKWQLWRPLVWLCCR